jgi:ATP-dependent DNA ligase
LSVTDDPDEACEWLDAFSYSSAEGLVVKGAATWYQPGRRGWAKVNSVGVGGVRQLACALTGLVRRWIVVVRT